MDSIQRFQIRFSRGSINYGSIIQFNYIMKKVRVVSFANDMPTGPPLNPYQILSNYLKQYKSYGLHKILASWEILHNEESERCLSCTGHAYWSSSSFQPNIIKICLYYQNMSKGIKVMKPTRMHLFLLQRR